MTALIRRILRALRPARTPDAIYLPHRHGIVLLIRGRDY